MHMHRLAIIVASVFVSVPVISHGADNCDNTRASLPAWQKCIEDTLLEISITNALALQIANRARAEGLSSRVVAEDAKTISEKAINSSGIAVNKSISAENIATEAKQISQASNGTALRAENSAANALSRTKSFGKSKCIQVDSAVNGGKLSCPAGYYVAGAWNTPGNNYILDFIECCSPE